MKTKIFTIFAAMLLLFSANTFAQSETTLDADVNKDGVVDVGDIAAVIAKMAQLEGEAAGVKYYWYAGQTKPTSMTSDPTPDDTTSPPTNNNWHTLAKGATSIGKTVVGGTSGNAWYVAVPISSGLKPTASDFITPNSSWTIIGTITVGTIEYTLWQPSSTSTRCAVYMGQI